MSTNYEPRAFLDTITGLQRSAKAESSADKPYLLGVIDPGYTSGDPKVTFEGELTMSGKQYPFLSSYLPAPSDRVVLAPLGTSYVILGSVGSASGDFRLNLRKLLLTADSSVGVAIDTKVNAEAFERFRVQYDGRLTWGDGANPRDTNLYRNGASALRTDDALHVNGALTVGASGISTTGPLEFASIPSITFQSYTPGSTGHGSATWATRFGFYFKIGKLVWMLAFYEVLASGSGSTPGSHEWHPTLPSTPDRQGGGMRQGLLVTGENVGTGGRYSTGHAAIFAGGSGAVIDRIRLSKGAGSNQDENMYGADLLSAAAAAQPSGTLITIQGFYKEA